MEIELFDSAVFAKASNASDFSFVSGDRNALPADVRSAAARWVECLLSGGNPAIIALHFSKSELWLIKAQRERAPDAAGRPRGLSITSRIGRPMSATLIPQILSSCGRQTYDPANPPRVLNVAPQNDMQLSREAFRQAAWAVAGLTFGDSLAQLNHLQSVEKVVDSVSPGLLKWVALMPMDRRGRLPDGPGTVISESAVQPHQLAGEIAERYGSQRLLDLPLSELPADLPVEQKQFVVVAALAGSIEREQTTRLSVVALRWLIRQGLRREALLANISTEQAVQWLGTAEAIGEDLAIIAERIQPEHRPAARTLLLREHDALRRYLRWFPMDSEGATELLSDRQRELMERLDSPIETSGDYESDCDAPAPAAEIDALLKLFSDTSLWNWWNWSRLSRAIQFGSSAARREMTRRLEREGFPTIVSTALMNSESPAYLPNEAPRIEPANEWLAAFETETLLNFDALSKSNYHWRSYWLGVLNCLLCSGRVSQEWFFERRQSSDADLLRIVGANHTLVQLQDYHAPQVSLPPERTGSWSDAERAVLREIVCDGSVFARISSPISIEGLEWLVQQIRSRDLHSSISEVPNQLKQNKPISSFWLRWMSGLLSRPMVLGQIAAWATNPISNSDRHCVLSRLVEHSRLSLEESRWLRSRVLHFDRLPPSPRWKIAELHLLLPILDPVNEVLRELLEQPHEDPESQKLFLAVVGELRRRPTLAPAPPSAKAAQLHPGWIKELQSLPGWEGFQTQNEPDTTTSQQLDLEGLRARARELLVADMQNIKAEDRQALEQLVGDAPAELSAPNNME